MRRERGLGLLLLLLLLAVIPATHVHATCADVWINGATGEGDGEQEQVRTETGTGTDADGRRGRDMACGLLQDWRSTRSPLIPRYSPPTHIKQTSRPLTHSLHPPHTTSTSHQPHATSPLSASHRHVVHAAHVMVRVQHVQQQGYV